MDTDKVLLSLREGLKKIAPPQIGSRKSTIGNLLFLLACGCHWAYCVAGFKRWGAR